MIKSNKGQALLEFVLLLPIITLILFIVIDFASIFYKKNHLEGVLNDVITMVENDLSKEEIISFIDNDTISYSIKINNNMATITLEQKIDFITPFSNLVIDDNFKINTKRVILYE